MCALLGLILVFAVGWAYMGRRDEGWGYDEWFGWVDGLGWGVDCEWECVGLGVSGVGIV